jgi:EpsI family protein
MKNSRRTSDLSIKYGATMYRACGILPRGRQGHWSKVNGKPKENAGAANRPTGLTAHWLSGYPIKNVSIKRTIIAAVLMILTIVYVNYMTQAEAITPNKPFSTFPKRIGEWVGREARFDQQIYDILGVDDSFLADYRKPNGKPVQLYVGFYQSQREGDIIHSPRHCMPGGGWNIIKSSTDQLSVGGENPKKVRVAKLVLRKGKQKQVTLYWFQSRGRFITSEYAQKIYLVWDSILKNRTDGSFIRIIAPFEKDEAYTTAYLKAFAEQLIPILQEYLPGA